MAPWAALMMGATVAALVIFLAWLVFESKYGKRRHDRR